MDIEGFVDLRLILLVAWLVPLGAAATLLYTEYVMLPAAPLETNRAMRTRMCLEHADLARAEPANAIARGAADDCVESGYITQADGIKAID